MSALDIAVDVAHRLDEYPDTRPEWVQNLPYANDPDASYYRALFHWASTLLPARVLEVGTDRGWSAAHISAGSPGAAITTVDMRPESVVAVRSMPLSNVLPLTMKSCDAYVHVSSRGPFDMLFIDANHTFNDAYGEYSMFRPLVVDGGLILFDDVGLEMAGDEMGVFWDYVLDRKARLDHLHHTGFGICEVDHSVTIPPWRNVIEEATRRILSHQ